MLTRFGWRRFKMTFAALALVALGFGAGALVGTPGQADAEPRVSPYARLNAFAKVMSYIERSFVDPPDQPVLIEAAIKGMVSSLDEHSVYFTPEEYTELRKEAEGLFVGIGLQLGKHGGQILVVSPIEGGPASRAGIKPGDKIVAINGESSDGWTLRDTVRRLKGVEGSELVLKVQRVTRENPKGELLTRKLVREPLEVEPLVSKVISPGLGYLRVRFFQHGVAVDAEAALEELETEAGPLEGLILDLRNNPGGLLIEGVRLADLFIDEGKLVITRGRDRGQNEVFRASRSATLFRGPVLVLVNGGTASASEIVAGAFQDHERGLLIGEKTYGKGSVQSIIDLKGGAGLKLTTARYYTPKDRSIHRTGVVPDLVVPPAPGSSRGPWYEEDHQVSRAIKALKDQIQEEDK